MAGSFTQQEKLRAGIYVRVSTVDQQPENQLADLRRYAAARGWDAVEYVDHGVSGSQESRPALDQMLRDARRRRIDAVICWKLDRLGRSLRHLIGTLEELVWRWYSSASGKGLTCPRPLDAFRRPS